MSILNTINRRSHRRLAAPEQSPPVTLPTLPVMIPLPRAPGMLGLSRSAIYRAAKDGKITLRKVGRSTLVETTSAIAYLASLPDAN